MGGKEAKFRLCVLVLLAMTPAFAEDHDFDAGEPASPSPFTTKARGIGVKKTNGGRGVNGLDINALSQAFGGSQGGTSGGNPLAALGGALGAAGFPSGPSESAATDFLDKFKSGMGSGDDSAAPPKSDGGSGPQIDPEALAQDTSGVLRLKALGQQVVSTLNRISQIGAETVYTTSRAIQGAVNNGGQRAAEARAIEQANAQNRSQTRGTVADAIPFVSVRATTKPQQQTVTVPPGQSAKAPADPMLSPQLPKNLAQP